MAEQLQAESDTSKPQLESVSAELRSPGASLRLAFVRYWRPVIIWAQWKMCQDMTDPPIQRMLKTECSINRLGAEIQTAESIGIGAQSG
jgi:hypothetical protein